MTRKVLVEEARTYSVIGAFFKVYNRLGFGFLEHLYVMALERELLARGHRVAREMGVRVFYEGAELGIQRLDMIVDETLVVETKSTFDLHKAAQRQVYNYLKPIHPDEPSSVGLECQAGRSTLSTVAFHGFTVEGSP